MKVKEALKRALKEVKKIKIKKDKMKNREVLKETKKVTVSLREPIYFEDKDRFFKKAWKEEKRQLFFD